jgi:hypothetical protein
VRTRPGTHVADELWIAFDKWADENNVGEDPEDYGPWWECFLAGFDVAGTF